MPPLNALPLQLPPKLAQAAFSTHGVAGVPTVEHFRLPRLWCLHWYEYHAHLEVEEQEWDIHPGSVSLIPPNQSLTYRFEGLSSHWYTHFSLETSTPDVRCPTVKMVFEASEVPTDFQRSIERMVRAFQLGTGGLFPRRAEVALWELLCQLAEISPQETTGSEVHPSLQKALLLIEERLATTIEVAALAREVGLSHNHLTRLFLAHTGRTVVAYIRHRRAERAQYLLQNSTQAIKAIAAQVGTPDLGQFNHLLRRETGVSPRAWRGRNGVGE